MTDRFRTILIGFGKIGARYAEDPVMARYFPYATHAQVLADHPAFEWEAVVDPSEEALERARTRWQVPYAVRSVEESPHHYQPEVAVIATPPQFRRGIIEQLPTLRAVLVEKPLGRTVAEGEAFIETCNRHELLVQVNLWRRADETFRALAEGQLTELVGRPQAVFGVYGNGLLNNGTHMVDLVRMLLGEIEMVQALGGDMSYLAGPLPGDVDVPFSLRLDGGLVVAMQPIRFEHYRENSLDIWGTRARLAIMNEGLTLFVYRQCENRAVQGAQELRYEQPQMLESTVGRALYHVYDNLAAALRGEAPLWSPGESALRTERGIQTILDSAQRRGTPVEIHAYAGAQRN